MSLLITLGWLLSGPIDYFNVQDKMAGREIDRGRLARDNPAAIRLAGANSTRVRTSRCAVRFICFYCATRAGFRQCSERQQEEPLGMIDVQFSYQMARTVTVGGKLHGAGANTFYEGIDNGEYGSRSCQFNRSACNIVCISTKLCHEGISTRSQMQTLLLSIS